MNIDGWKFLLYSVPRLHIPKLLEIHKYLRDLIIFILYENIPKILFWNVPSILVEDCSYNVKIKSTVNRDFACQMTGKHMDDNIDKLCNTFREHQSIKKKCPIFLF